MKINYDMNDNYFKYYNEGQYIYSKKKKFKFKKNIKIKKFTTSLLQTTIFSIFLWSSSLIFFSFKDSLFGKIFIYYTSFLMIIHIILDIYFFYSFKKVNITSHKGTIIIDEKGITDNSESGLNLSVPWDRVDITIVGINTITILLKTNDFLFILPKSIATDVIKGLKKYNKDLAIIDNKSN